MAHLYLGNISIRFLVAIFWANIQTSHVSFFWQEEKTVQIFRRNIRNQRN